MIISGALSARVGKTKWQLVGVCVILTAFTGGMGAATKDTKAMALVFSVISSSCIGFVEVLCMAGAMLAVPAEDIGLASGVLFMGRSITSALSGKLEMVHRL